MTAIQRRLASLGGSVVVLAALGAYAYYGTYQGKKKEAEQKETEEKVATFKAADVKELRLTAKGAAFEMAVTGEGDSKWSITKPTKTLGDKTTIDGIVSFFADLKRKRQLDAKPEDLRTFGLEPPTATVAFKAGDATTTFLIGKKNTFDDAVYLMKEGDTKVAMVPGGLTYQTDRDLFQLREKRLLMFEERDVTRVEAEVGGKPAYALDKSGDDWSLSPSATKADKPQVTSLISNLRNLRAKSFPAETADAKDLGKYGLDKPAAAVVFTLGAANAKTRVVFGVTKAGGGSEAYYARAGDGPVVELSESGAKKVDVKPVDLRDKSVIAFDREQVKKIKLSATGKDFILLEKKDTQWEVAAPDQKPANDGKVSNLLYKLSTLKAKTILAEKVTPELKVKHGLEPVKQQVTLYKADGSEAGTLLIGATTGDDTAVLVSGRDRLDALDKNVLSEVSFDVKDYVKEEPKEVAGSPTGAAQ